MYPFSFSLSKHTEEFVTPFEMSVSSIPVNPVSTVEAALLPVRPCGLSTKSLSFSLRSFPREIPVRRSSSARLTFSRSNLSPRSDFISLSACAIISVKSLFFSPMIMVSCCIGIHQFTHNNERGNGFFDLTDFGFLFPTRNGYFNSAVGG